MKRTCKNCKAYKSEAGYPCGLGHDLKVTGHNYRTYDEYHAPAEECPKPLTFKKYRELLEQVK